MPSLIFTKPFQIGLIILTGVSIFWFPWPISIVFMFLSGLIFPPFALLFGILADVLYYPGQGYFYATLAGVALTLGTWIVRHFVKTRIM